jgi:hypothetical protein
MSHPMDFRSIVDGVPLSSAFLELCGKVRNNDRSLLPDLGEPFKIRDMREREGMELADALLEDTSITYLELVKGRYTDVYGEAMAKYVRTSQRLQRIRWITETPSEKGDYESALVCCFLLAFQESTSLKELDVDTYLVDVPSNLALENMLTHTQSLQSLHLRIYRRQDFANATQSGLKNNTTLRELILNFMEGADVFPILTSLCDHPLLQRLCLRGQGVEGGVDLAGLETVLLSDTSKITELEIDMKRGSAGGPPMMGLTSVLQALGRRHSLIKLGLRDFRLGCDEARQLGMVLRNTPRLQSLNLASNNLGSAGLAELAPALYHNTSIKELNLLSNGLEECMESARLLRDILRHNKTITTLGLSGNRFGETNGAVECIADGMGSNSTLLKINLWSCGLGDGGVSTLAQNLGSRNTTLQKLFLGMNRITSMGLGVLLETMEQNSHITDLVLKFSSIGNEGTSLLARSLGNNALPNLARLSLDNCGIEDDGFIALVSALELNTSLLHLDLRYNRRFSERAFLALAESLPEIKVLQRLDFSWSSSLALAMPLLLTGLGKNTSLFRFHVIGCVPSSFPPTPRETARCASGWMQEMERVGYRNGFIHLLHAPKEGLPPRGVWPRALSRVSTLPDVLFEVLRSKPSLMLSADTEDMEATEDTDIPKERKHGDE